MSTTTASPKKTTQKHQQQQNQYQKRPKQQQQRRLQQNQQLLLFGLTILIGNIILAPIGATPITGGDDSVSFEIKRRCSNALSDAIREICGGRFYSLGQKYPNSVGSRARRSVENSEEGVDFYYRPLTSGPIHECCRRPCGYPDLKSYCATQD